MRFEKIAQIKAAHAKKMKEKEKYYEMELKLAAKKKKCGDVNECMKM